MISHIKSPLNFILIHSASQIFPLECLQSFLALLIALCLPDTYLRCGWAPLKHQGVNGVTSLVVSLLVSCGVFREPLLGQGVRSADNEEWLTVLWTYHAAPLWAAPRGSRFYKVFLKFKSHRSLLLTPSNEVL